MADERIPADQQAVLRMLISRSRSYDEIAGPLGIDAATVRGRAVAALSSLAGPTSADLSDEQRGELTDAIVGGGAAPAASSGEALVAWDAAAREGLAALGLTVRAAESAPPSRDRPAPSAPVTASEPAPPRVSRTGGALLIAAVAAAAILVGLWQTGALGGDDGDATPAAQTTSTTGPTNGLRVIQQVNMSAPNGGSAKGAANIAEQDGKLGLAAVGAGLAASNFYALWYRSGETWHRLGFFPAVAASGKNKGQLSGYVSPVPADLLKADELVVSLETQRSPKSPAQVVLTGNVSG